MLSKLAILSSLIISRAFGADFEYPEENWDAESVLGEGVANYCGSSHQHQSPINILTNSVKSCPTQNKLDWKLNTDITTFRVENTGHNLRMVPIHGDIDSDDNGEGESSEDNEFENEDTKGLYGVLKNNFGFSNQHPEYYLDSVHIHWGQQTGTGSEHRMDSKQSSMEAHFVHYSNKYENAGVARDASQNEQDPYTLAVVGVLFEIGEENAFISKIIDQVSKLATPDHEVEINGVSMSQLVPMDDDEVKGEYYHYKGSLTTPPCTPAVSWHVLEQKLTISQAQIDALNNYVMNDHNNPAAPNYRDAKTNLNPVYKCSAGGDDDESVDDDDEQDD